MTCPLQHIPLAVPPCCSDALIEACGIPYPETSPGTMSAPPTGAVAGAVAQPAATKQAPAVPQKTKQAKPGETKNQASALLLALAQMGA